MWETISFDPAKISQSNANVPWREKSRAVSIAMTILQNIVDNSELKSQINFIMQPIYGELNFDSLKLELSTLLDTYAFKAFSHEKAFDLAENHGILSKTHFQGAHYVDVTLKEKFLATALCELVDFVCICKDMFNFYNVQGKTKPTEIDQYLLKYTFPDETIENVTNLFKEPGLFSKTRIEDLISQCYDDEEYDDDDDDEHKHLSTLLDGIMNYLKVTDEITPAKEDSQFTKFSGGEEGDIKNLGIIQDMINSDNKDDVKKALDFFYPPDSPGADTSANIRAANAVAALIHAPQRNIVSKFVIEQFRIAQQALKEDLQEMKVLAMSQTADTLAVRSEPSGPPVGTGGQFATLDIASLPFSFRLNK